MRHLITLSRYVLGTVIAAALLLAPFAPASLATEWQPTHGPYGGRVVGLRTDGTGSVYAARHDEIFRSDDGGATWINVSNGAINASIRCLFVTPAGDLYAGVFTRGVYWSFDGGASWDHDQITHDPHGGLGATILAIGVNANGVIFAGGFRSLNHGSTWLELGFYGYSFAFDSAGNVYAGTSDGVRFSADEGATWTVLDEGLEGARVVALALNSHDHIFAGTWDAGVFLSTDGGLTWNSVSDGLPSLGVKAISIDAADRVYLAPTDGGLYLSANSGTTWDAIAAGLTDPVILSLETSLGDDVYVGSQFHGVFHSDDQGVTWVSRAAADMGLPGLEDLAFSALAGDYFLAADGGGIYRSTNGGSDWEERSNGLPTTRAHAVASDASGRIYAATEDGVYASSDAGATWFPANAGHEGTPAIALLVDSDDNVVTVLTPFPLSFEFSVIRSIDGGTSWQEVLSDLDATLPTTAEAWAIDADDRIYLGGMSMATEGVIFGSDDDGGTWEEMTFPAAVGVTGLAVGPGGVVYATMGDNDLYASTDHGVGWTEIPNGGWPTGTVGVLDVVAVDFEHAILVSSRNAGIWRSTDEGATWSPYNEGLPAGDFPTVTFLKTGGDALFAGTLNHGLFRRAGSTTSIETADVPAPLAMLAVSPNPFNPQTTISFFLKSEEWAEVGVYTLTGQRVVLLADRIFAAGEQSVTWHGGDSEGRALPSGTYLVRLDTESGVATRKATLVR